jgi:hypothetical protein
VFSTILAQAAARGEISADRDWSMVADVVLAMGLLQVVRGQSVDATFVRQLIDTLVLPAVQTALYHACHERRLFRRLAALFA